MDFKKIFGENLKLYRKILKLSQEELSEKLDISINHLSNIETGKKFISSELLDKIYDVLEITPSSLFYSPDLISIDENQLKKIDSLIDIKIKELKKELRRLVES